MAEKISDIKSLIRIREQRPSFSRMISWEIGQSSNLQPVKKKRQRKKKPDIEVEADSVKNEKAGLDIGAVSGEETSEYETACEDQDEIEMSERLHSVESAHSSSTDFPSLDAEDNLLSLDGKEEAQEDNESGDEDFLSLSSNTTTSSVIDKPSTEVQQGCRRRLSKKQKKKRAKYFRVTYLDELYNLGNLCDTRDDIDEVFTDLTESGPDVAVQRKVPTLVELCLQVNKYKRKARSNSEKGKIARTDNEVPYGLKRLMATWGFGRREIEKQLSFFLNKVLPVCEEKVLQNLHLPYAYRTEGNTFIDNPLLLLPRRSVWAVAPCPPSKDIAVPTQYASRKTTAFLFTPSAHYFINDIDQNYYNMTQYYRYDQLTLTTVMYALATTIDLMLPGHMNNTTSVIRVKRALGLRYKVLVEKMFEKVLPYVMWARGHVSVAVEMFKNLVDQETASKPLKAMYLSEIARMHAMFGDCKTAALFYKLASETAVETLENEDNKDETLNEVSEQTQILLASVHDSGVLDKEKAEMSYSCWMGVKNIPHVRNTTLIAGFDALLCYHLTHWDETSPYDSAISKMEKMASLCNNVYYYQSMLHALKGSEDICRTLYRQCRMSMFAVPGERILTFLGKNVKNPWQPLIDIVRVQRSAIQPCQVVWRSNLQPPRISKHRPMEGQVNSTKLNLHLNDAGYVCGDMQMLLPPLRNISLDPYTGSLVFDSMPASTGIWQTSFLEPDDYHFVDLLVPTPMLIYSGSNGATVHLVKPGTTSAAMADLMFQRGNSPPSPCVLFWRGPDGQTAKLNILTLYKDYFYKGIVESIKQRKVSRHLQETSIDILLQLADLAYEKNYILTLNNIEDAASSYMSIKKKEEKDQKGRAEKSSKRWTKKRLSSCFNQNNYIHLHLVSEPFVMGDTVVLAFKSQSPEDTVFMFIRTTDRKSFWNCSIISVHNGNKVDEQGRNNHTDEEYFMIRDYSSVQVFNARGVKVFGLADKDVASSQDGSKANLVIIGSYLYGTNKDRNSIWRTVIVDGDDELDVDGSICWTVASLYDKHAASANAPLTITNLTYVGTSAEQAGKLLMVTLGTGLVFISPADMELVPITLADECARHFEFTDSGTIIQGDFETLKILAEQCIMEEDVHISRTAFGVQNKVFILDICHQRTEGGVQLAKLEMVCSLTLPGAATEACFIGKQVGMLVSLTQHDDQHEFYREHVFHFDLKGYLHGVLLCLGRGPRSFCPVYLHGNQVPCEGEGQGQSGWHVYLRDGRDGILCVRLNQ